MDVVSPNLTEPELGMAMLPAVNTDKGKTATSSVVSLIRNNGV